MGTAGSPGPGAGGAGADAASPDKGAVAPPPAPPYKPCDKQARARMRRPAPPGQLRSRGAAAASGKRRCSGARSGRARAAGGCCVTAVGGPKEDGQYSSLCEKMKVILRLTDLVLKLANSPFSWLLGFGFISWALVLFGW